MFTIVNGVLSPAMRGLDMRNARHDCGHMSNIQIKITRKEVGEGKEDGGRLFTSDDVLYAVLTPQLPKRNNTAEVNRY